MFFCKSKCFTVKIAIPEILHDLKTIISIRKVLELVQETTRLSSKKMYKIDRITL